MTSQSRANDLLVMDATIASLVKRTRALPAETGGPIMKDVSSLLRAAEFQARGRVLLAWIFGLLTGAAFAWSVS